MTGRREQIVCRGCDTVFPVAEGSCPRCGTRTRGRLGATVAAAIGLGMLYVSLSPFDPLLALVGLAILAIGVRAHRDRQRRFEAATRRR